VELSRTWPGVKLGWSIGLVRWGPDKFSEMPLEDGLGPDLASPPDKSDETPLEAGPGALEVGPDQTCSVNRTSPAPPPDKSSGSLWSPVVAF
jgi:hypothetical protein